ncbi:hypothetical protein IT568_12000, partial [bacterium]|nr:hypothetical protein [bacterium]
LQEKLLKKLASEVFPGLRNKCLGAKLNVRGALKWLNENPATLKLKKNDVRNWEQLFEILKKHSGIEESHLFMSLDTEVQEKLRNLPYCVESNTFKFKIIDNLNRLIQKKDFFVLSLVSGQDLESDEFRKVAYLIKKLQRKEILQTFEREKLNLQDFESEDFKKLAYIVKELQGKEDLKTFEIEKVNRFIVERVLGTALKEQETYFDETCYAFGLSIQTIASEAVHGEDFNEKEILFSLIEAMKVIIRRFGELCEKKH